MHKLSRAFAAHIEQVGVDMKINTNIQTSSRFPSGYVRSFKRGLANIVKPVLNDHTKRRPKIGFQDRFSLNASQKYCRMLQWEHSAILSTCIKLPFVNNIFVLPIFEWTLETGLTVNDKYHNYHKKTT